jgi:hypothetical protein
MSIICFVLEFQLKTKEIPHLHKSNSILYDSQTTHWDDYELSVYPVNPFDSDRHFQMHNTTYNH